LYAFRELYERNQNSTLTRTASRHAECDPCIFLPTKRHMFASTIHCWGPWTSYGLVDTTTRPKKSNPQPEALARVIYSFTPSTVGQYLNTVSGTSTVSCPQATYPNEDMAGSDDLTSSPSLAGCLAPYHELPLLVKPNTERRGSRQGRAVLNPGRLSPCRRTGMLLP
jgi:hypothetical protein